jgi:hypothetical protein
MTARARALHKPAFQWGKILGQIALQEDARVRAAQLAREFFEYQQAQEFCGNDVESYPAQGWFARWREWFPLDAIRAHGFVPAEKACHDELVATLGVDPHTDAVNGPTFCLTVHNAGLKFRQGRVSCAPVAGEYFLFNDALPHSVKSARGEAAFLGLVIPLTAVGHRS